MFHPRYGEAEQEIVRLRAEVAEAKRLLDPAVVEAARYLLRNADTHPHTCCVKCAAAITEAEAEVARLTREVAAVEGFRAAPLATIRKLLGDHESPDEAIAGSVCAILLTRQETVRRKQAAEKERDALRACVTQLRTALLRLRADAANLAAGCPVRSFDETLGEVDSALERSA